MAREFSSTQPDRAVPTGVFVGATSLLIDCADIAIGHGWHASSTDFGSAPTSTMRCSPGIGDLPAWVGGEDTKHFRLPIWAVQAGSVRPVSSLSDLHTDRADTQYVCPQVVSGGHRYRSVQRAGENKRASGQHLSSAAKRLGEPSDRGCW